MEISECKMIIKKVMLLICMTVMLISCACNSKNNTENYEDVLQGVWDYYRPAYTDPDIGEIKPFGELMFFNGGNLHYASYSNDRNVEDYAVDGTYSVAGNIVTTNLRAHEEEFEIKKEGDEYVLYKQYEGEDEPRIYHKQSSESTNEGLHSQTLDSVFPEELQKDLNSITNLGEEIIECLSKIDSLEESDQYIKMTEADEYTAKMIPLITDAQSKCLDQEDLAVIEYQLKLLKNICPEAITGSDSTSIADQKLRYRFFLKQLSSTFAYLSEYMNCLENNKTLPEGVRYYSEVPDMPTPDSIIHEITYSSEMTQSGVKLYTYKIGEDETDANLNYNIYLKAIEGDSNLTVDIQKDITKINKDGIMVAAMQAGVDDNSGHILTISFKE